MPGAPSERLLVTGASGRLGRRVVEILNEAGVGGLIATTRHPEALADFAAKGVEVRRADFDDPAQLIGAFAGAGRLLLISTDAVDEPGRRVRQQRAAVAAAEAAGVRHLVYTSCPAPRPTPHESIYDSHFWTEASIVASRMNWTILRHNFYAEIALLAFLEARKSGELVSATGKAGRAYIARDDLARVDAAALLNCEGREILDATGPEAVTPDALANLFGELSGRVVVHRSVSIDEIYSRALAGGATPAAARRQVDFNAFGAMGYHAVVTSTVADLTGRPPTNLVDFLRAHVPHS